MVQAVIDIHAIRINRYRRERQSCELQATSGERETRILDPDLPPFKAEHMERQSEAAAEAARDDDPGRRTLDTARDGKIRGYFPPQFQLATRVRIYGWRAHGASTPLSMAARMPLRICSARAFST